MHIKNGIIISLIFALAPFHQGYAENPKDFGFCAFLTTLVRPANTFNWADDVKPTEEAWRNTQLDTLITHLGDADYLPNSGSELMLLDPVRWKRLFIDQKKELAKDRFYLLYDDLPMMAFSEPLREDLMLLEKAAKTFNLQFSPFDQYVWEVRGIASGNVMDARSGVWEGSQDGEDLESWADLPILVRSILGFQKSEDLEKFTIQINAATARNMYFNPSAAGKQLINSFIKPSKRNLMFIQKLSAKHPNILFDLRTIAAGNIASSFRFKSGAFFP